MIINPEKRLFWFLKDNIKLDLSNPSVLDMYIQQVITYGRAEDIRNLFRRIGLLQFKGAFKRLAGFLPFEVKKFWEDAVGNN